MSFATTLDRLVDISDHDFKYSGHLSWDTFQIPQDPTAKDSPSPSNNATIEDYARWIQEPLPARLKLLLITTVHPTASNSLSQRLGEPHKTKRERQANAVKRGFLMPRDCQSPDSLHMSELYYLLPRYPPSAQPLMEESLVITTQARLGA
jgi:hypothetical protein